MREIDDYLTGVKKWHEILKAFLLPFFFAKPNHVGFWQKALRPNLSYVHRGFTDKERDESPGCK